MYCGRSLRSRSNLQGDKAKSLTDLFELKFTMPELVYENRTWSFQDLVHHIKRGAGRVLIVALVRARC